MKLFGSTKSKISKDEKDGNFPRLEITEVLLLHSNTVDNDYQQDTFVPNKPLGQLLNISPKIFIFLKSIDSEFSYIEVWSTDQSSKPLEIGHKINIDLVIN